MPPKHEAQKSQSSAPPAQTPGMAQRSAPDGAVRRALRGLGFEGGSKVLKPSDGPDGNRAGGRAPGIADRVADLILDEHGKTPEGIAEGLKQTGSGRDRTVIEALEARVGVAPVRKAVLSEMLVRTGRANGDPFVGKLGGARSAESDVKAEESAGVVLRGMEKATRLNQSEHNRLTGKDAPLTHAVSGHGKGTDQYGRLLHGRRADELAEDAEKGATPSETATFQHPTLGAVSTPKYDTIGQDPSNVSGAFTTHQGMLHAVTEGFAQANMVSAHGAHERGEKKDSGVDRYRFATSVSGRGDELGYNLEVTGKRGQKEGMGLAADEMAQRAASIEKTGGLKNATVVLDPAYVGGKRAGWNLQTAYAHDEAPAKPFRKPEDVRGTAHDVETRKRHAEDRLKERKDAVKEAERELDGLEKATAGKQKGIDAKTKAIGNIVAKSKPIPQKLQQDLDALKQAQKEQEDQKPAARQKLEAAKRAVEAAEKELRRATEEHEKMLAAQPKLEGGGGGKAAPTGYDPATGLYSGGRPDKPDAKKSLKGEDEDKDPLTAHHLYPWNQIERDLNDALGSRSRPKMERLLKFGEVEVADWFWKELAKPPAERTDAFSHEVDRAAQQICWAPSNVFMGPLGSKRGDDPGEKLDQAYTRSGLPTPATALAELIDRKGGIGTDDKLVGLLTKNVREAHGGKARKYDQAQWETDAKGKKVRKRRVPLG